MGEIENRPPIPADIKRRVLVEAGHRCAIPTCRYINTEIHHIIPWETCHKHEYENLIALCPNCHARADKGEIDRKSLRAYKANLRFAHDKFSNFEVDMLFECYTALLEGRLTVPFTTYLLLLIKRMLEIGYITYGKGGVGMDMGGLDCSPVYLSITPEGIEYVNSLGLEKDEM